VLRSGLLARAERLLNSPPERSVPVGLLLNPVPFGPVTPERSALSMAPDRPSPLGPMPLLRGVMPARAGSRGAVARAGSRGAVLCFLTVRVVAAPGETPPDGALLPRLAPPVVLSLVPAVWAAASVAQRTPATATASASVDTDLNNEFVIATSPCLAGVLATG